MSVVGLARSAAEAWEAAVATTEAVPMTVAPTRAGTAVWVEEAVGAPESGEMVLLEERQLGLVRPPKAVVSRATKISTMLLAAVVEN